MKVVVLVGLALFISSVVGRNANTFELKAYYPPLDLALLTYDPETGCIGRADTPRCAFETWNACRYLSLAAHCEKVGITGFHFSEQPRTVGDLRKGYQREGKAGASRLRHERWLTAEDENALENSLSWAKAGYVELAYSYGSCITPLLENPVCEFNRDISRWLFLKPVNGDWHVVGWIAEIGGMACEYDDPSDLDCKYMISSEGQRSYWPMLDRQETNNASHSVIPTAEREIPGYISRNLADPTSLVARD